MNGTIGTALTTATALSAGVTGGVYVAFSAMVLPALRNLPAADSLTAMQRINVAAVQPPFMALFFGGAALSAGLVVAELSTGPFTGRSLARVVGASLALASFGLTIAANVPLNNALAGVNPAAAGAADAWQTFNHGWSRANLIRAGAAMAGAALLTGSLLIAPN
ncbi:DUF1772 domain-containing protein [Arthrobacter sp. ZGTC131]|uniref:anthrone oxygenase family protein n=1 Tax=Arthrobacter sp. ZGTC131 TaxID=2058898 RepID=UPI00215733A4|nr:anthrone oxygenase family protein [Arthrobacter sp. ZGTC131]